MKLIQICFVLKVMAKMKELANSFFPTYFFFNNIGKSKEFFLLEKLKSPLKKINSKEGAVESIGICNMHIILIFLKMFTLKLCELRIFLKSPFFPFYFILHKKIIQTKCACIRVLHVCIKFQKISVN